MTTKEFGGPGSGRYPAGSKGGKSGKGSKFPGLGGSPSSRAKDAQKGAALDRGYGKAGFGRKKFSDLPLADRLLYSEAKNKALREGKTKEEADMCAEAFVKGKKGKEAKPPRMPGGNPVADRMAAMHAAKQGAKGGFGAK